MLRPKLIVLAALLLILGNTVSATPQRFSLNGHQYYGDMVGGDFQGQGKATLKDGTQLQGRWKSNNFLEGEIIRSDGVRYQFTGELNYIFRRFSERLIVGTGSASFEDGSTYRGSINRHGHFHGMGTLYYPDGKIRQGLWSNSKPVTLESEVTNRYKKPVKTGDGWMVSHAEEEGLDTHTLSKLSRHIEKSVYENIHGIVVIRNGKLVFEEYYSGFNRAKKHELRSVSKTIASILTGLAIDHGYISSVEELIHPYFKSYEPKGGWDENFKKITIRNLLNMTSGMECDDWKNQFQCLHDLVKEQDWLKFALNKKVLRPPGSHYAYSGVSLILLGEVIARASKMTIPEFADKYLFTPLHIVDVKWNLTKADVVYFQMHMRPRDMAKLGYLFLNDGQWKGQQILSPQWIEQSTRQQTATGPAYERFSIHHKYLWWFAENTVVDEQIVSSFYATGNGGQIIVVYPALDLVVAVTAGNHSGSREYDTRLLIADHIIPSIATLNSAAPAE